MSFCFCADQKDVAKNIYEVNRELSGGELSLSACPGVGNRPLRKKKIENPRGCVWGGGGGGGMVTSKIEPCIICGSCHNKTPLSLMTLSLSGHPSKKDETYMKSKRCVVFQLQGY